MTETFKSSPNRRSKLKMFCASPSHCFGNDFNKAVGTEKLGSLSFAVDIFTLFYELYSLGRSLAFTFSL